LKASFSGIFWGLISVGVGCFFLAGGWEDLLYTISKSKRYLYWHLIGDQALQCPPPAGVRGAIAISLSAR
jgi:hypothetical protein